MKEIWKDIPGYEGKYQASTKGRIWSSISNKIMSQFKKGKYPHYYLYCSLLGRPKLVHRLIATTFILNHQNKRCVNHKDFDKCNNYYSNLEWVTDKENTNYSKDRMFFNKKLKGESHPRSLFTNDQVIEMRKLRESGMMYSKIARKFNSKQNTVLQIFRRKGYTNSD